MNILYLSEDYSASKVHHELVCRLVAVGHNITVFTVVRLADRINDIRKTYGAIDYRVCSYSLPKWSEMAYKVFFGIKRRLKFAKLIKQLDPQGIDIVHAATLFSEGIIAYELYKKYHIPYTVAVRGTDIELYLSKMPHLWNIGKKILRNSSKIIFISPNIQQKFENKNSVKSILPAIREKFIVIPNGIEDFWIDNRVQTRLYQQPKDILYIGRFDENKNVERLVKSVLELRETIANIHLNMVGGGDVCHSLIMRYCEKYPETFTYLGKIYDKQKLLKVIRNNQIFAMVSHSETFGLVYLEALSQGLPILYTEGQGIDSSVPNCVGEKAKSKDQSDITYKLKRIIENYPNYQPLGDTLLNYSWETIASKYSNIFKQIYH